MSRGATLSQKLVASVTIVFLLTTVASFMLFVHETQFGVVDVRQDSLLIQAETLAAALSPDGSGGVRVDGAALADPDGLTMRYAVTDATGRTLWSLGGAPIRLPLEGVRKRAIDDFFGASLPLLFGEPEFDPVLVVLPSDGTGSERFVAAVPVEVDGALLLAQASARHEAAPLTSADILGAFAEETTIIVLLPLALALVAIPLVVRRSLRPLKSLARQADAIAPGSLDTRLDTEGAPVELRRLVSGFNEALDRLEAGFALQRAFTANAAHELRTPVAALRAEIESGRGDRAVLTAQCDRMGRMLGQLLALAEAERQSPSVQTQLDLGALARQVLIDHGAAAMSAGRSAEFEVAPEATAEGDPGLTEIALRNLIENAARHAPPGAGILVASGSGVIEVSDDGPPIPPEIVARMFERFWKADRRSAGSGLGLSIVKAAMARQGGSVRFERRNGRNVFSLCFRRG